MSATFPAGTLAPPFTRPDNPKSICKVCKRPYPAHGMICLMCGSYAEHHKDSDVAECIAGRRRMALARQGAGVPLDDVDRVVLSIPVSL